MKKFIVLACMLIAASTDSFAQTSRAEMNKEYAEKYKEVGTDPTLSGYEKGQKKRELGIKQGQDNANYTKNSSHHHHHDYDLRDKRKKEIERKIDRLEDRYKRDKEKIEKNDNLSKKEKKFRKKVLEKDFKAKKEVLKKEKNAIK